MPFSVYKILKQVSTKVITVPNLLTFLRMALIPVFASLLFYGYSTLALIVFIIAGISDGIDGFIARRYEQESELGTVIDPIADKLLMTTAFIILTLPNIFPEVDSDLLPVPFWVTSAVIGRDVLIVTVAAAINIMTGFSGFKPSWLGKLSTTVQVLAVALILLAAVFHFTFYLMTVYVIVVLLAALSGFHYIFFVASLMKEKEDKK